MSYNDRWDRDVTARTFETGGLSAKKERAPRVSVVIPSFNRAGMIEEAIGSVLAQTYENFELIVIDDGSTDNTPLVLENYGNRVLSYRQRNGGVSAARNKGIESATGSLIAFLDSDDLWLPEKLACQVDFFDTHPDAMICQTEETWIKKSGQGQPQEPS